MTEEELQEALCYILVAEKMWNEQADQYNKWDTLSLVEKVVLILRETK